MCQRGRGEFLFFRLVVQGEGTNSTVVNFQASDDFALLYELAIEGQGLSMSRE